MTIAWKIWTIHRNVNGHSVSGVRFMGVISVIVESGARPPPAAFGAH